MRQTTHLIEQILETGKRRGLNAEAIASRAGIKPTNLSRIRKSGRFNADTLERLLAAVDGSVEIKEKPEKESWSLPLISKKLNAGRRKKLSEQQLRQFALNFRPSQKAERAFSHLIGLIEEVPIEQIHSLILEGDASLSSLKRIVKFVKGEGKTADWINDQLAS